MPTGSIFFRRQLADGILSDGRALDLGCGIGRESLFLAQHGYQVEAVDKDAAHTKSLSARAREDDLPVRVSTTRIEQFEILSQRYSLIVAKHSLPFIADAAVVMRIIKNMVGGLKAEGLVCFTLFGNRDGWNARPDMSFFEYSTVIAHLETLPISLYCRSSEEYFADTTEGVRKFWSVNTFCYLKKPISSPHLLTLLK
jgi:SAM-dependent methyltransferase